MATQLHRDALHVGAGQRGQVLAYGYGAGKRDLAHYGRADKVVGHYAGYAPHYIKYARGQAGIVEHAGDGHDRAGRVFGAFKDDGAAGADGRANLARSEEHTSELQSLMRISYAVFCLKKKKRK